MNLFEMLRRRDANLEVLGGVIMVKIKIGGRIYRALRFKQGSSLRLKTAFIFYPFSAFISRVGWMATAEQGAAEFAIEYENSRKRRLARTYTLDKALIDVEVPFFSDTLDDAEPADLMLTAVRGTVTLCINEVMNRKELIALCQGKGVELGPGHQPQILPSSEVDVIYVEEKPVSEWSNTYNASGNLHIDEALWKRYVVGSALDIPVPDGNLDFVFSSHLLEHLVNPLRFLERWSRKLRSDGIIAGIVPDVAGCKDYVFFPSNPAEWEAEYQEGQEMPRYEQYVRYATGRNMLERLDWMIETRYSIHVHFYTLSNICFLLRLACERGWYKRYFIEHKQNNKDFHFVLIK